MAQVLHLGHFKTGSTGLQRLVFRQGPLPYHGINDGGPPEAVQAWIDDLRHGRLGVAWKNGDFVYSNESGLLRLGGRQALDTIGRSLVEQFSDPHVVLTVREPASLLASAYVQSLRVRRQATGDFSGRSAYRLLTFDQWWRVLVDHEHCSLAGLLDYGATVTALHRHLGSTRVTVLPLEMTATDPERYRAAVVRLGFPAAAVTDFLTRPALNSTADRLLRRPAMLFHGMGRMPAVVDRPWFDWLHRYREPVDVRETYAATIDRIRDRYRYDPESLLGSASDDHPAGRQN